MRDRRNVSLFWYGFFSKVKSFIGTLSIMFAVFMLFFGKYLVMGIFLVIGIILIMKGKSQRFDYKRQSGTIIHGGDW